MFRYNVVNFLCLLLGTIFCPFILFANSNFGNDPSNAVSEYTMIEVFDSHGIETARHKDNLGDPHLTFLTKTNANEIAVFFDGCGTAGCEEVTLYADFGIQKSVSLELLNDWNHIGQQLRTTAFKSGPAEAPDGPIGLSMHLSMYSDEDIESLKFLTAMFLVEVDLFKKQIK